MAAAWLAFARCAMGAAPWKSTLGEVSPQPRFPRRGRGQTVASDCPEVASTPSLLKVAFKMSLTRDLALAPSLALSTNKSGQRDQEHDREQEQDRSHPVSVMELLRGCSLIAALSYGSPSVTAWQSIPPSGSSPVSSATPKPSSTDHSCAGPTTPSPSSLAAVSAKPRRKRHDFGLTPDLFRCLGLNRSAKGAKNRQEGFPRFAIFAVLVFTPGQDCLSAARYGETSPLPGRRTASRGRLVETDPLSIAPTLPVRDEPCRPATRPADQSR